MLQSLSLHRELNEFIVFTVFIGGSPLVETQAPEHKASVVAGILGSLPTACGIFPDQQSNLCPLHWQADS